MFSRRPLSSCCRAERSISSSIKTATQKRYGLRVLGVLDLHSAAASVDDAGRRGPVSRNPRRGRIPAPLKSRRQRPSDKRPLGSGMESKVVPVDAQQYDWFSERLSDLRSLLGLLVGEAITPTRVSARLPDENRLVAN
jgi:hypothetical protein